MKKSNKKLAKVHYFDLYGKRDEKYAFLRSHTVKNVKWQKLDLQKPCYFFVPKDFSLIEEYEKGFKVNELFVVGGSGIKFRKDNLLVKPHFTKESVITLLKDMHDLSDYEIHSKYKFRDTKDWILKEKRQYFVEDDVNSIHKVLYRPFDFRYTYYPLNFISKLIPRGDARIKLMKHMLKENIALIAPRMCKGPLGFEHGLVTNILADVAVGDKYSGSGTYIFPLYLYSDNGKRKPNFNPEIVKRIEKSVGKFTPEELFDYIYAVLHSITYREKYKEFLKIDFPRIPYPKDSTIFTALAKLGAKLRKLHLMEDSKLDEFITTYPVAGSDIVEKVDFKEEPSLKRVRKEWGIERVGKVYINDTQYFGNVPKIAWDFYIGGYQPAQKWLKDRKGRKLTNEDIEHYQKIIVVLRESRNIMHEISNLMGVDSEYVKLYNYFNTVDKIKKSQILNKLKKKRKGAIKLFEIGKEAHLHELLGEYWFLFYLLFVEQISRFDITLEYATNGKKNVDIFLENINMGIEITTVRLSKETMQKLANGYMSFLEEELKERMIKAVKRKYKSGQFGQKMCNVLVLWERNWTSDEGTLRDVVKNMTEIFKESDFLDAVVVYKGTSLYKFTFDKVTIEDFISFGYINPNSKYRDTITSILKHTEFISI